MDGVVITWMRALLRERERREKRTFVSPFFPPSLSTNFWTGPSVCKPWPGGGEMGGEGEDKFVRSIGKSFSSLPPPPPPLPFRGSRVYGGERISLRQAASVVVVVVRKKKSIVCCWMPDFCSRTAFSRKEARRLPRRLTYRKSQKSGGGGGSKGGF